MERDTAHYFLLIRADLDSMFGDARRRDRYENHSSGGRSLLAGDSEGGQDVVRTLSGRGQALKCQIALKNRPQAGSYKKVKNPDLPGGRRLLAGDSGRRQNVVRTWSGRGQALKCKIAL